MELSRYIDIYCERLEPGLWAEPVNALTNLSFIIAAFFAYRLIKQKHPGLDPGSSAHGPGSPLSRGCLKEDVQSYILIILIAVIGTGSFLFHTHATFWAMMTDVLPILLFQVSFLFFYARDIMKLSLRYTGGFLGAFFLTIYAFGQLPEEWLNGSLSYAPAILFLLGLSIWHYIKSKGGEESTREAGIREPYVLLLAALIFIISLTFRSIDMALCPAWPLGTHFLWHVLNGLVLYLTARAYILNTRMS